MKKNLFIALEGIDGSGKSTQIRLLTEKLLADGHKVHATFEPTDGPVGKMIRSVLKGELEMDERAIAGLFVADRLDHILNKNNGLLKNLEEGFTVLTDRYYFSSYAYHGAHLSMDWVIQANSLSTQLLRPNLTIYIDISPEASMERISKGRESTERYETLGNLSNVRNNYLKSFEQLKHEERIVTVDGNQMPEEIAADIYSHILALQ